MINHFVFESYRDSWPNHSPKSDRYDDSYRDEISEEPEEKPRRYDEFQPKSETFTNKEPVAARASVPKPNNPTESPKKTRPKKEVKKIDLGAAAVYAQEHQQSKPNSEIMVDSTTTTQQATSKNADLLTDLFTNMEVSAPQNDLLGFGSSPVSQQQQKPQAKQEEEFADFAKFDAGGNGDDFADFQCAFDNTSAVASNSSMPDNLLNSLPPLGSGNNVNSFTAMNPFLTQPPLQQVSQPSSLPPMFPSQQLPQQPSLLQPVSLSPTPLQPQNNNTPQTAASTTSSSASIGSSHTLDILWL